MEVFSVFNLLFALPLILFHISVLVCISTIHCDRCSILFWIAVGSVRQWNCFLLTGNNHRHHNSSLPVVHPSSNSLKFDFAPSSLLPLLGKFLQHHHPTFRFIVVTKCCYFPITQGICLQLQFSSYIMRHIETNFVTAYDPLMRASSGWRMSNWHQWNLM